MELGGAEALTYREMMSRYARLAGRPPRRLLKVPMLTPRLSSYWVALVTPVDLGLVNGRPVGFEDAMRAALR